MKHLTLRRRLGASRLGFTLIELMIAVAVVALLAAIAIPSYSAYVLRGQRAAAKAALLQAAQSLERNYTTTGCYSFSGSCGAGGTAIKIPTPNNAPTDGGAYTYQLTVVFPDAQSFQLAAAPCGSSATACPNPGSNAAFKDSTCGALLLDNTGQQAIDITGAGSWTGASTAAADIAQCWQR